MSSNNQELKELQKVITEAQAKIDKMVAETEAKKSYMPWVPERGDTYWVVSAYGSIVDSNWSRQMWSSAALAVGNVFKTKQKAKDHVTFLKADTKIVNRIKELNEGWVADFTNRVTPKYSFYWSAQYCIFETTFTCDAQHKDKKYYLKDRKLVETLIRELHTELMVVFGVKV